jgi:nucleoid-associated protein YgaU
MSKYRVIAALGMVLAAGMAATKEARAQTEPAAGPAAVEAAAPGGGARMEERWRTPFAVESSGSAPPRMPRVVAVRPEPGSAPEIPPADSAPVENEEPALEKKSEEIKAPAKPASAVRTHIVARGDTLYGIARRYRVSAGKIREANRMDSAVVKLGQKLVIPGG